MTGTRRGKESIQVQRVRAGWEAIIIKKVTIDMKKCKKLNQD